MAKLKKETFNPDVLFEESRRSSAEIPPETLLVSRQAFLIWDTWSDPECYTENRINWIDKYFYYLHNAEIYNAYAECLGRQKEALKQIRRFQCAFEKELRGDSRQIVPGMLSYCLLKNQKLSRKIKNIGKKYLDQITVYFSDNICGRSGCKLYLNPAQFQDYQLLYGIIQGAINGNQELKKEFFFLLEQEYPQIYLYVTDYKNRCNQDSLADALFTPFLYGWIRAYYKGIENGQINEILSVLYLMVLYKECPLYGKEINLIFHLLYRIYCNPVLAHHQKYATHSRKRMESAIYDNMDVSLYRNMNFLNFLNELLVSEFFIQIRAECLNIILELGKCKQTEINGLLSDYYGFLFYKSKVSMDDIKNIDEFDHEFMESVLDVLQYECNLMTEERSNTVQEKRRAEAGAEKWKSFFFYAAEWLSRRAWKKEDSDHIKEDGDLKHSEDIPDCSKDEIIFALRQENDILKKNDHDTKMLLSSISELQKEKKLLLKKIDEAEKDKKELISLRNYIYEEGAIPEESGLEGKTSDMADFLNKKVKGIIVGGHPNFHNKISKYLPEWKKYPPRMKIPTECITGADMIVFYTDHIDHSTYLSVIAEARKNACKLLYIHNVNMDTAIKKIFEEYGGGNK